jgi:hypothetical protein
MKHHAGSLLHSAAESAGGNGNQKGSHSTVKNAVCKLFLQNGLLSD